MGMLADTAKPAVASNGPVKPATNRPRLDSIDIVRGIVMVLMALDHVKHYFCRADFQFDAVDLTKNTTPALFFTRWITHFCAPTFVFLAGTGVFLYGSRGKSRGHMAWYLLSRGLWLILLEITVVRLSWSFNLASGLGGGVIFAIGCALIALSGLIFLPESAVAAIGVAIICFHNLLDNKTAGDLGLPGWLWTLLHRQGEFQLIPDSLGNFMAKLGLLKYPNDASMLRFGIGYCLLPWIGVMAAGYGFGAFFLLDRPQRRRQLIGLGIVLTLLFVGLRFFNEYGDLRYPAEPVSSGPPEDVSGRPGPRSVYEKPWFTVLSFLNCQKYPPSLLFLLMTLGPAIVALGLFDTAGSGPIRRFFVTFGRVPLFFYLIHLPVIHGLAVGVDYLRYHRLSPLATDGPGAIGNAMKNPGFDKEYPNYGFSLPETYLIWVGVIILLYPLCWWFARIKQRYRSVLLTYL